MLVLVSEIIAQEYVVSLLLVVDRADLLRHAVAHDHMSCDIGRLTNICGSACSDVIQDQLLGNSAAQAHHDLLQHAALGHVHLVFLRQLHGITAGAHSRGNDGNGINPSHLGQLVEENGVSRLVESGDALLLVGDHMALFLLADADLDEGFLDIGLCNIVPVRSRRADRSLVHEVFQIRAGETGSRAGDLLEIHVLAQRLVLGMDLEDVLSALYIRSSHRNLSVEAARTKNGGIKHVHTVGGRHDNDALVDAESVHLHKELVQGLLALVVRTAEACTSAPRHRVDLIDENDAG